MDDKGNQRNMGNQGDLGNTKMTYTQPVSQPQASTQQVPASGSMNKEAGPARSFDISDIVKPSEAQPVIEDKEVSEAGVEAISDVPKLTPDHIKAGIQLAKDATPVATSPSGLIKGPITEEEAKDIIRTNKNVSNSVVWLAKELLRQVARIRI